MVIFSTIFAAMSVVTVALGADPSAAANTPLSIYFYDPDANYDAIPRIIKGLNEHFSTELPGCKLHAVDDVTALLAGVAQDHAPYALVSSASLERLKKFGATPLLVPEAAGTVYYHKVLVDIGSGPADLQKKRIAVASGDQGAGNNAQVMGLLSESGIPTKGAVVITTSKDFDALLGLTFSQADAAFVTSDSIAVLKTVNPGIVQSLRILWTSPPIMRPVLAALRTNEDAKSRDAVLRAFVGIMQTKVGKAAMESLGFDRWVPYTAATHIAREE